MRHALGTPLLKDCNATLEGWGYGIFLGLALATPPPQKIIRALWDTARAWDPYSGGL